MAPLLSALLLAALFVPVGAVAAAESGGPERPGVAVAPFVDRRNDGDAGWLAAFFREGVAEGLRRTGRLAVMPAEPAGLWLQRRGLAPDEAPAAEDLAAMGVDHLVQGSVHRVATQARLWLRLTGADPDHPVESVRWQIDLDLGRRAPAAAIGRVLAHLFPTLLPDTQPPAVPRPASWQAVERYYRRVARPPRGAAGLRRRIEALEAFTGLPGLGPQARMRQAAAAIELALVHGEDAAARRQHLRRALEALRPLTAQQEWRSHALALKGEVHHFLEQHYEAKTEASVARIRNRLEGLAHLVLGLAAGLSTGEGDERVRRALAVDPFLDASERPQGVPPAQGGALEPVLAEWRKLQARRGDWTSEDYDRQMKLGDRLFEAQRWADAEEAYRAAAEMEPDRYQPRLGLARIRLMAGEVDPALQQLRTLAAENPLEWEVWYWLGRARQRAGEPGAAAEAYRRALQEEAGRPQVLYHLATARIDQQQWGEARAILRRLLERQPRHARAWVALGVVESRQERWNAAVEAFRRALMIDPDLEAAQRGAEYAARQQQR